MQNLALKLSSLKNSQLKISSFLKILAKNFGEIFSYPRKDYQMAYELNQQKKSN